VDGIGIVRYPDALSGQLVSESYRPRAGDQRHFLQLRHPLGQLRWAVNGGLPDPGPVDVVERGEDLAAPAVEDRQPRPRETLADPRGQDVERAYPTGRQAEADAEPAGAGDPDPQAGEGAGAEADREQVDRVPAARRRGGPLDLLQQPGRVQGPPLGGKPKLRLVQDIAVAPGAGDGVDRRGVEADDYQGCVTPSP
jgi:hypothetical protein